MCVYAHPPTPQNYKTVKRMVAVVAKIVIGSVFAFIYLYTAELYPTTVR